jgi:ATP-binding cassette subfamily B protein
VSAPSLSPLGLLRSVRRQARGEGTSAGLLFGLTLVQVAYGLVVPLAYKVLFDEVVPRRDVRGLIAVALALAGSFVVFTLAGVFAEKVAARAGTRIANGIRERLFEQIQRVAGSNREAGDLVSRFAVDLTTVETSVIRPLPLVLQYALSVVLSVALLFWVEWHLALGTLLALPLALVLPQRLGPRATASTYERKRQEAVVTGTVQETVGIHAVVRAFALEPARLGLFRGQLRTLGRASDAASFWGGLVGRAASVSVEAVQILVVVAGCLLVIRGWLTAGALIGFVGLLLNVGGAAHGLAQLVPPLIQATGSMQRIDELLEESWPVVEAPHALPLDRFERELRLEDVTLRIDGRPVVDRVSLAIRAGQSVAFVGSSGSGKSTLLSLVMRFVDPSEGRVTIDGRDARALTLASLRALFGVVLQDTALFNTSVRENIRLGRLSAGEAEIVAAAKAAQLHETVSAFEAGYAREVGDRGSRLSGGQRQRVAIARAIVRDPAILVLDEPTSALDPATATAIHETLHGLEAGRTTISVTHRLDAAAHADAIFLMDAGRLVEQGTHRELLARGGLYHALWHKQGGLTLNEDGSAARIEPLRLRRIPLLAGLPESLLRDLAEWFGTERVPSDRLVVAEGDFGDKLFVIVRGTVEVFRTLPAGPVSLSRLEDGDVFGEIALLRNQPRNAGIRTRSDCVFLTLHRQHFAHLLEKAPDLREALERVAASRVGSQG